MRSKDIIKAELREKLDAALSSENSSEIVEALADFAAGVQVDVLNDFKAYQTTKDAGILAQRGIRQLTEKESGFYNAVIKAYRTGNISAAFDGIENAFPETVIDSVLEDIRSSFPLLSAIRMQNTATITKMIVNKKGVQLAVWGPLGSKITEELEGAIGKVDIGTNKLTAFLAISKDMLDAGPAWVDAYIRAVLSEASGAALCKSIVAGTGKDEPIGMLKDVSPTASVTNGVYPDKAPVVITDFSPKTMGGIAKLIATGPNDRTRPVPELLMVVNPKEYFDKVMPATTFLTPNGSYVNNVLPYPTKIVQDANVPDNRAIFGLASRYFMGVGKGGSGGKIEYSDEVRFLDDERVYVTKMYGNGMPLDENAFVVADISGVTGANLEVVVKEVKGVVKTKEQTA